MKKIIKIVLAMLIVSIAGSAKAQTGTSFFRPGFEYQTDPVAIDDNFREAFQKAFEKGDLSCFERKDKETPSGATPFQIIQAIANHIKVQAGMQVIGGIQILQMFKQNKVRYTVVGPEYWDTHETAYFTPSGGIAWWDPRRTQVPLLKERKEWVIETFYFDNGTTADFCGNCANLVHAKIPGSNTGGYQAQAGGTSSSSVNQTQTQIGLANVAGSNNNVVVNYGLPMTAVQKSWLERKWWIPVLAAVVIGGTIYAVTRHKDASKVRDTGWQDGSTSPWTPGTPQDGQKFFSPHLSPLTPSAYGAGAIPTGMGNVHGISVHIPF